MQFFPVLLWNFDTLFLVLNITGTTADFPQTALESASWKGNLLHQPAKLKCHESAQHQNDDKSWYFWNSNAFFSSPGVYVKLLKVNSSNHETFEIPTSFFYSPVGNFIQFLKINFQNMNMKFHFSSFLILEKILSNFEN